jgi:hypothetical protein
MLPIVATSFPPELVRLDRGEPMPEYDRICVKSWVTAGFRVLGVNAAGEIPALAARHPEAEFVAAPHDAMSVYGRPVPTIPAMLAALAQTGAPIVGVINSDIMFEPSLRWPEVIAAAAAKCVVAFRRYDVRTLAGGALYPYWGGFDAFFFDHAAAAIVAEETRAFAIGIPWWDYWLPLTLRLRGYRIREFGRPAVLHIGHEVANDPERRNWRRAAIEFGHAMLQHGVADAGDEWRSLASACQNVVSTPPDDPVLDDKIMQLINPAVLLISPKPCEPSGPDSAGAEQAGVPAIWFASLGRRVAAATWLHGAIRAEQAGDGRAAQIFLSNATNDAPKDPAAHCSLGDFLARRGEWAEAAICYERAAMLAPRSGFILNALGEALRRSGQEQKALACFVRAGECGDGQASLESSTRQK